MDIIDVGLEFSSPLVKRSKTDYIILHHAAGNGSVESIHRYHKNTKGWLGIAYNFYVRKDGTIYIGRGFDTVGGHTTNYNYNSIGICFEGNFDNEQMSDIQFNAGVTIIIECKKRYNNAKIIMHKDVAQTACPGKNFPFERMCEKVSETMPSWAKESCEWALNNGIFIGDANGDLNWNEPITRAEAAIILERFLKKFIDN